MPLPILLDAYQQGFKATFSYNKELVDRVKCCLGFQWNKDFKFWWAQGPEVLLDMERYRIPYVATRAAQERIDDFRLRLQVIAQLKNEPIEGQFGYQTIGTHLLITQQRAILADDLGLGKSKQALDALALVWPRLNTRRVLIVAPKTLTYNWYDSDNDESEIMKWHPEMPAVNVPDYGPKKRELFWKNILKQDEFVLLTNPEKLRLSDFPRIHFDVVIIDEASKIVKNSRTATFNEVQYYSDQAKYVWALTGTPLEIRLEELYSIMKIVRPAVFGGFYRFAQEHLSQDPFSGSITGSKNHDLLKERYGPWITRRTKKEAAPWLPPLLPPVMNYLEMEPWEKKEYDKIVDDFGTWQKEQGGKGSSFNQLVQMVRMQQFCCSPNILDETAKPGTKFEALKAIIDEWDGQVVVFSQYTEMTERLHSWLKLPERAHIRGNQGQEAVRRGADFSKGRLGKVLVSSDAGGYGLNIVGADLIIHYDQTWNPARHKQREGRLHRTGQTKPVNVIYMLYRNSIEQGKRGVLEEREMLFGDVVDDVEAFTKLRFSQTDFMKIARGEWRKAA